MRYYQRLGALMGIKDIPGRPRRLRGPDGLATRRSTSRHDPKTRAVAEATLELLVSFYPRILAKPVDVFSRALMDDALLAAFGFKKPSPLVVSLSRGGLRLRGRIVRFMPPRRKPSACQGPQAHQDLSRRIHGRAAWHVPRHDARDGGRVPAPELVRSRDFVSRASRCDLQVTWEAPCGWSHATVTSGPSRSSSRRSPSRWARSRHTRAGCSSSTTSRPRPRAAASVVDESKPHTHNDPATKNAISRAPQTADTADPTTFTQAIAHSGSVIAQRSEPTPSSSRLPRRPLVRRCRRTAMPWRAAATPCSPRRRASGSCGTAAATAPRAARSPAPCRSTSRRPTSGPTCCSAPTRPSSARARRHLPARSASPSAMADWTVTKTGSTFTFTLPAKKLSLGTSATGGAGQRAPQRRSSSS